MPKVGKKDFPYTASGYRSATREMQKKKKPIKGKRNIMSKMRKNPGNSGGKKGKGY